MKKNFLLLFVLLFATTFSQTKNIFATLIPSATPIETNRFLGIDTFGSIFYSNENILYRKTGNQILEYKNLTLGNITSVDFINPLYILILYEQYNTIIALDNQLNEVQKITFAEQNSSTIGMASQNRIWVFDQITQQIGLYDINKKTYEIISQPIIGAIKCFNTNLNYFQWIDSENNLYTCSIFGKISSPKKVPDFEKIQIVFSNVIIYSKEEHLYFRDLDKEISYEIKNVKKSFDSFFYKDQILSIFTNQELMNYKIIIP
jgi:hypothetical protein